MDSTDLLYAIGRSTAILVVGTLLCHWFFKKGQERVWIWWTVVAVTILSFMPLPRYVVAFPTPLQIPEPRVYENAARLATHTTVDSIPSRFALTLTLILVFGAMLFAVRMWLTWRHVKAAEQIASPEVLREVTDIGSSVGMGRLPIVLTSDRSDSAYATGLLNPVIVLPLEAADNAPADERRAILCHEMLHVRRRDHWFVAFIDLWFCLFVWNPIAWIGRNMAFNAMEEANDERTVSSGLVDKAAYLRALLRGTRPLVAVPIARFHGQSSLRARIEAIADGPSKLAVPKVMLACACVLCLAFPWRVESMPHVGPSDGGIQPDQVVFCTDRGDGKPAAYVMRMDGRDLRPLFPLESAYGQVDISPDGRQLAFITGNEDNHDIYVCDIDGKNRIPIATLPGEDVQPHFSPDGKKILYTSRRDQIWQIYLYDLEAKTSTRISDPRYRELEAKWHPSGDRIIFSSYRSGLEKIWSKNLDGTNLVQISYGDTSDTGGIYSRCGRYAFYMKTTGGGYDLYRMDLAKGVELRLTHAMADDGEANVSPDNRWVFFTTSRNRRVQIARMMLDGTNERVISPIDGSWPQTRPISGPFQPAR